MANPSENWYVRSSSLGDLMSKGRGKEFGATAMKVIQDAVLLNKYGIKTQIQSKYLDKGIINEPEALKMFARKFNLHYEDSDSKKRLFNDYMTGEPDIYKVYTDDSGNTHEILGDVKCSFSASTFPFLHDGDLKSLNKSYYFQMMSYMWLTNCHESYLAYCLTDTPDYMMEDEVQRRTYKAMVYPENSSKDMSEIEDEVRSQVHNEMKVSHMPEKSRIRVFKVEYDQDAVDEIQERIIKARKLYDELFLKL